jgi:signal transduction histidine kinase
MVLNQTGGYAAAVILPWIGTNLGLHTRALQSTPFALTYASIAGITLFWGLRQGLLAAICTTAFFNYYVIAPSGQWTLNGRALFYSAIIFSVGLLVIWICHRQNVIGARLRTALASYRGQTEALMEAQQGSNSVAWTLSTADGRIEWAEGGAEVFGRPFSVMAALDSPESLIVEEDRSRFEAAMNGVTGNGVARSAKIFHAEYRVRWPNGEIHWLESRGTPSPTDAGIWRGVTIDVTDRKNAELALIRSEKLAAIGRLSATIAHEINNPLEAVTNLLFLALSDEHIHPETRRFLEQADEELRRLASIARHTLTFVRTTVSGSSNFAVIAESVVSMFEPRCSSRGGEIRLFRNFSPTVAVPPDDLRQILTNLVSNACDALMDSAGVIEVEITAEHELAVIEVRDTGAGIAVGNLDRVFDAFFTTKEGVGTGIGLWVTKELVEKNGGRVSVRSGGGAAFQTIFRVEFPLAGAVLPAGSR